MRTSTIDFGFVDRMGVGNLALKDLNSDGKYTLGVDAPVDGCR